eukprot:CAMPEP_0179361004 /NCGR_PEP_ID=MMETSP0797-20121207/80268_1 /TAXON_ID=47934 /ORGANISM="Dinophysis acuminata, Strain DAEP01" /LENGTH=487 /DNA_ID=CAMNT_0021076375 /DNA_START=133 /DNA_END=1594 /DNA_ORIENTATION=-
MVRKDGRARCARAQAKKDLLATPLLTRSGKHGSRFLTLMRVAGGVATKELAGCELADLAVYNVLVLVRDHEDGVVRAFVLLLCDESTGHAGVGRLDLEPELLKTPGFQRRDGADHGHDIICRGQVLERQRTDDLQRRVVAVDRGQAGVGGLIPADLLQRLEALRPLALRVVLLVLPDERVGGQDTDEGVFEQLLAVDLAGLCLVFGRRRLACSVELQPAGVDAEDVQLGTDGPGQPVVAGVPLHVRIHDVDDNLRALDALYARRGVEVPVPAERRVRNVEAQHQPPIPELGGDLGSLRHAHEGRVEDGPLHEVVPLGVLQDVRPREANAAGELRRKVQHFADLVELGEQLGPGRHGAIDAPRGPDHVGVVGREPVEELGGQGLDGPGYDNAVEVPPRDVIDGVAAERPGLPDGRLPRLVPFADLLYVELHARGLGDDGVDDGGLAVGVVRQVQVYQHDPHLDAGASAGDLPLPALPQLLVEDIGHPL